MVHNLFLNSRVGGSLGSKQECRDLGMGGFGDSGLMAEDFKD